MESPAILATQQSRHPNRTVSGPVYAVQPLHRRPTLASRLSIVRSTSQPQPANVVDLTADFASKERKSSAAFLDNVARVCKSPDKAIICDVDEDGNEEQRPAKRVKLEDTENKSNIEAITGGEVHETGEVDERQSGSPLPPLPKAKYSSQHRTSARQRPKVDAAARKANGIEPPAIAIRLVNLKKVADFSPWTGHHPEDILNETVIKHGLSDKAPAGHAELSSAKSSIWSNLNQKINPLQIVSSVFASAMDKRQAMSRCTAPSTFRPPPRVTVTDTKREAWLRDLANPGVPLRRQSRTIPHGVRGKILVEQCLSKEIPLQRAIWLAKCVGANELRGMRRKGVSGTAAASGENKWIRDWTVQVEQFFESVVMMCGQQGWKAKIEYAVKLTAAFYTENLLESEHYLDWILSSLAEATLETLPIWIVIVQLHWKPLVFYEKRGRKLATTILDHLHHFTAEHSANHVVKVRLQKLIAVLATSNRGSLIVPLVWDKYKHLLSPKQRDDKNITVAETPASNICDRNERLAKPLTTSPANTRSALLVLYSKLDALGIESDLDETTKVCASIVSESTMLVSALLGWASTQFRTGPARVYIAARLIGNLRDADHDTDACILEYLPSIPRGSGAIAETVHMVVAELVRKEKFSVGRCLQWLITNGAMSVGAALLAALPLANLPPYILNTRNTLLRRQGHTVDYQDLIDQIISGHFETSSAGNLGESYNFLKAMPLSAQNEMVNRVLVGVAAAAEEAELDLDMFCNARYLIESAKDVHALATLVNWAVLTDDLVLFATAADTLRMHAECLAAAGELRALVDRCTERYKELRSQQTLDRAVILALKNIIKCMPSSDWLMSLLNNDLNICDQQNSLAVCSPASDSLICMQGPSLDSDADIDAVFASGNIMDELLLHRIFTRILQQTMRPSQTLKGSSTSKVCAWLNRLRCVDVTGYDQLVQNHLRSLLSQQIETKICGAIAHLVASGTLSLGRIAELAKDGTSIETAATLIQMFFSLDAVIYQGLTNVEQYRYQAQQKVCQAEHADTLTGLLLKACHKPVFHVSPTLMLDFLLRHLITQDRVTSVFETEDRATAFWSNMHCGIRAVLGLERSSPVAEMESILRRATALSIAYSVMGIRTLLRQNDIHCELDEETSDFSEALIEIISQGSEVWPQLLEHSGDRANASVHLWARNQLLLVLDKDDDEIVQSDEHMSCCIKVMAITKRFANAVDDLTMITAITERLRQHGTLLSMPEQARLPDLAMRKLELLLSLAVCYIHPIDEESELCKQARCNLLASLCQLYIHTELQSHHKLVEHLHDLCSVLANNLPEALTASLKLPNGFVAGSDARLKPIIGSCANPSDTARFALVSPSHNGLTQQQRALNRRPTLNKQPSISGQSSAGASTPTQQRSAPGHISLGLTRSDNRAAEMKMVPFPLRHWEIMPDSTPVMGENDSSLSLALFGARRV